MPEDDIERSSFTVISIDTCIRKQILPGSIFDNWTYKIIDKRVTDYLDGNRFKTHED